MKLPRIGINLYKAVLGVCFSLVWARVMYLLWDHPSYIVFVWFYLAIGGVLLKWVIFEIIDRVHMRLRLRAVKRELEASDLRAREAERAEHPER